MTSHAYVQVIILIFFNRNLYFLTMTFKKEIFTEGENAWLGGNVEAGGELWPHSLYVERDPDACDVLCIDAQVTHYV